MPGKKSEKLLHTERLAYEAGRRAYREGKTLEDNPYTGRWVGGRVREEDDMQVNLESSLRTRWFNGWLDERRWKRWGPYDGEVLPDDLT